MNANERDEITASVAAHAELGSGYDSAVAEGLVERIGEEIDRRISTRLGPGPAPSSTQPPAYYGPSAQGPVAPVPPPPPVAPRHGNGWTGMVLGLGSMGLGVGATAVVVGHHVDSFAAVLMVFLIWLVIGAVNFAHARRR